jgi:hypothetical protein
MSRNLPVGEPVEGVKCQYPGEPMSRLFPQTGQAWGKTRLASRRVFKCRFAITPVADANPGEPFGPPLAQTYNRGASLEIGRLSFL